MDYVGSDQRRGKKDDKDKDGKVQDEMDIELLKSYGNSLFASVKKGRAALQSVVDEWIESYRQDRNTATLELLQFFSLASGCKGKITPQMKETMDNGRIIRELVEEFDDQAGGDYPIITNGPQWKKFRSNFCEFVHTLIRQCQYSIIYDQYLMENMISFLITLSDSQVRAFRHTATLAAMKLMTALVDVALTLSINIDNTQRQYDKARLEKGGRGDKLDGLQIKRQELDDNMEDIKTMLGYLFKSIFVHRYRDIIPEIRALCMYEIGIWMKRFPNYFLDDSFLKYVGWTLHDKVGDVRLKCLQSLLPLYETEEIARKMELFTNKFKERIVAMSLDKEYEVAVQAVKLIISIHKYHREVLTDKDCEHVYELVYATHRNVAQAAGEFLNERLFQVDEEVTANLCSRRGKKRSVHTPLLRDLITFFIESELHEHGAYLVDSLIESHPMMKDWECMTDLLLEEPGPDEEALDDRQETSLIEIMVCAIKQAATGEYPIGRGPVRKQISTKEAKQVADDKNRISEHFIVALPLLLDKYKTDPEKIANLMTIPQYFELSYYSQTNDQLESLLRLINVLVEIHSDSEVLEACAKAYEYLYDENFTFKREVWVSKSSLLDTLVLRKHKDAVEAYSERPNGRDEREAVVMISKKIAAFISCHDMSSYEMWDTIFERWIRGAGSENADSVPEEAIKYSISVCYYALIWELHTLSEARNQGPVDHYTRNRLIEFIAELRDILTHPNEDLAQEAYFSICDLLLMFDHQLENDSPAVAQLVYRPNNALIKQLETFIMERVFVYDEESEDEPGIQNSVERLHKKRHLLAGYCKLIIYNVIPMRHAICVIRHYVRFFNDFGDIIKTTLGKLREMNKVICAKTMASALIQVFKELQTESHQNANAFTKQDENFLALKELAKRFALSFGLDNQKNRDAVASLHREGIHFSFDKLDNPIDPLGPPPNLPFLEILSEFSNKLIKQDKKTVLLYLDKCVQSALPGTHNDEWQPLMSYRSSLIQHNEFDLPLNRAPGRQYRGRKRNRDDNDEEGVEEDQIDRESEVGSEIAE
ncbi:cohesin subunit SA-1-like [Panonychus citri]|uniref:cohesin subunit SA-1-like n=1 Tax=Panonychus citri TaxID=50023 RepID=UPI00230792B0|nr:cohesin subunit SA-1-like [Panonychus citri]